MRVPLSVVVITKNEADRIADCLESVKDWADEIIVVDDESTDNTREIARLYTNRVLIRKMDIEGKHRNWAHTPARNDWILSLDADERLTEELKREIGEVIKNTYFTHFSIPSRVYINDYRLKSLFDRGRVKLFKKDALYYEEVEVHPRIITQGECGHLKNFLLHYTYRNFKDFVEKLNRQTDLEAKKWFQVYKVNPGRANYKMNVFHVLWRIIDRFFRTLIGRKAYRDGFIGFMLACFSSLYQLLAFAKYWEIKRNESSIPR